MKARRIVLVSMICLVALCSLSLLVACDNKTTSPSGAETTDEVASDTLWQARVSRDADELKYSIEEAMIAADNARSFAPNTDYLTDIQENTASGFYNATFNAGNDSYRDGDYLEAEDNYNTVLRDLPTHFGANNNLTLALLQQQKNEEAMIQALKTVLLYPEELGCLLNVQVAGDACGFHPNITEEELTAMLMELGNPSVREALVRDTVSSYVGAGSFSSAYDYNFTCSVVDFEIGSDSDIAFEYENVLSQVVNLSLYQSSDPDAKALLTYLQGAAKLNGLDVSKSGS